MPLHLTPETCISCSKSFPTILTRRSHCKYTGHATVAFICGPCELHFPSSIALELHMQSATHDSSTQCPSAFLDGREDSVIVGSVEINVGVSISEQTAYCQGCDLWFASALALDNHLANREIHNWCFKCSRDFKRSTDLTQHENSITHQERDQACPFCEIKFKSASCVALHIESGCHKVTRHQVTAAIQAMDIVPKITLNLITAPPPTIDTSTTYIATEASFNGSAYACSVPNCFQTFSTLRALDLHLNSAAHDEDVFKCPKCGVQFKLISGFIQHLESRSCGLAKMTQIEHYFNDLTGQFSRLLKI